MHEITKKVKTLTQCAVLSLFLQTAREVCSRLPRLTSDAFGHRVRFRVALSSAEPIRP